MCFLKKIPPDVETTGEDEESNTENDNNKMLKKGTNLSKQSNL